ncbi:MAG: hypothetical protein ACTSWR_12220, partial [Candidatus Helarchaeota archaeon]
MPDDVEKDEDEGLLGFLLKPLKSISSILTGGEGEEGEKKSLTERLEGLKEALGLKDIDDKIKQVMQEVEF